MKTKLSLPGLCLTLILWTGIQASLGTEASSAADRLDLVSVTRQVLGD